MAKNMRGADAERLLTAAPADRRRMSAVDFLRAKAHLITNDTLRRKLTEPRAHPQGYGRGPRRGGAFPGGVARGGGHGFLVKDGGRGGGKDARPVPSSDHRP